MRAFLYVLFLSLLWEVSYFSTYIVLEVSSFGFIEKDAPSATSMSLLNIPKSRFSIWTRYSVTCCLRILLWSLFFSFYSWHKVVKLFHKVQERFIIQDWLKFIVITWEWRILCLKHSKTLPTLLNKGIKSVRVAGNYDSYASWIQKPSIWFFRVLPNFQLKGENWENLSLLTCESLLSPYAYPASSILV